MHIQTPLIHTSRRTAPHRTAPQRTAPPARRMTATTRQQEERRQVEEADKEKKAKADKIVKRSAEEQAERARLLGEYGYDSDPLDEDGNPLPPEEGGEGEGAAVRLVVEGLTSWAKPGADWDRWRRVVLPS